MLRFNHIFNKNLERGFSEDFYYNSISSNGDPSALLHCTAYFDSVFYPGVRIDDLVDLPYTGYFYIVSGETGSPFQPGVPGENCVIIDRFRKNHQDWLPSLKRPLVRRCVLISNTPWHLRLLDVLFPSDLTVISSDCVTPTVANLFMRIRSAVTDVAPDESTLEGLMFSLIQALHRCNSGNMRPPELSHALEFINTHLSEPIGRDDIARVVSISASSLTRLFRKQMHCAPAEYIAKARLDYAKSLLENPRLPLKAIAQQCGFNTQAYFSGCFRKAFGSSPMQYRKTIASLHQGPGESK